MKIGIQTWGSEGEIRPAVAMAAGLAGRGHAVTVVVTGPPRPEHVALAEIVGARTRLSPSTLGTALFETLSTPSLAARARSLRPALLREGGVDRACELVEAVLPGASHR